MCINIEGQFESITVEIDAKHGKHNLIISEIYRVSNIQSVFFSTCMAQSGYETLSDSMTSTHIV